MSYLECSDRIPFSPTPLRRLTPVPSDLEIANEARRKPITLVAEETGLFPHEIEQAGPHKAKVKLCTLRRLADRHPGCTCLRRTRNRRQLRRHNRGFSALRAACHLLDSMRRDDLGRGTLPRHCGTTTQHFQTTA